MKYLYELGLVVAIVGVGLYARTAPGSTDATFARWATPFCGCLYALVLSLAYFLVRGDRAIVLFGVPVGRILFSVVLACVIVFAHVPLRAFPPTASKSGSFLQISVADLVQLAALAPAFSVSSWLETRKSAANRESARTTEGMSALLVRNAFSPMAIAPRRAGGAFVAVMAGGFGRVVVVDEAGRARLEVPLTAIPLEVSIVSLRERADGAVELLGLDARGLVRVTLEAGVPKGVPIRGEDVWRFTSSRYQVAWHDDGTLYLVHASVDAGTPNVVLRIGADGAARALAFAPRLGRLQSYEIPSIGVDANGVLYVAFDLRGNDLDRNGPFQTLASGVWRFGDGDPVTLARGAPRENVTAMHVAPDGRFDLLVEQARQESPDGSNTPLVVRRHDSEGRRTAERTLRSSGLGPKALAPLPSGGMLVVVDFDLLRLEANLEPDDLGQQRLAGRIDGLRELDPTVVIVGKDGSALLTSGERGAPSDPGRLPLHYVDPQGNARWVALP